MKFNYRPYKIWSADSIREMCICKRYYTCGDTEAYSEMLDYVRNNSPKRSTINWICHNIYEHTDVEKFMETYGCDEAGVFEDIFYEVNNIIGVHCEVLR